MKIPRLNPLHLILVLLLLAVVVNSVIHYTSPAYRYYREAVNGLRSDYTKLRKQLLVDLLPTLQLALTNKTSTVSYSSTTSFTSTDSLVTVDTTTNCLPLTSFLSFDFFSVSNSPGFSFNGRTYAVGDLFLGSPVVFVSPTFIKTVERNYIHSSLSSNKLTSPKSKK